MAALSELLERIEKVPPLSAAAAQLMRLQGQPDRSIIDTAKVVEIDAGLTVAVLKSSNSAAARPAQPITSVRQAVTYLGERTVMALALSACVPGGMSGPLPGYGAERGALWRHSLRSAVAARDLAGRCRRKVEADLAFTAGVLHDIGKPIVAGVLKGAAAEAFAEAATRKDPDLLGVEKQLAGMTHAEVGEALARRWKLAEPLQAAIRYHHEPSLAPEELRPLTYSTHVAVMHAVLTGFDAGVDDLSYRLDTSFLSVFDLSEVDFGAMMARVDRAAGEAMARVGEP